MLFWVADWTCWLACCVTDYRLIRLKKEDNNPEWKQIPAFIILNWLMSWYVRWLRSLLLNTFLTFRLVSNATVVLSCTENWLNLEAVSQGCCNQKPGFKEWQRARCFSFFYWLLVNYQMNFLCLQVRIFFSVTVNLPCSLALLPQISLRREGNYFKGSAWVLFQEEFSVWVVLLGGKKIKTNSCNFFYSCSCQQLCLYRSRQNWRETAYTESTQWQGKFMYLCILSGRTIHPFLLSLKPQRDRFQKAVPEA